MNSTKPQQAKSLPDVPAQVFEAFLDALAQTDTPKGIQDALRRTLLETRDLSERALRNAVLPEESLP